MQCSENVKFAWKMMTETSCWISCTSAVVYDVAGASWNLYGKCNMLRIWVIDTKSRENLLVKRLCRISSCGGKLRSLLAEVKERNICRAEEIRPLCEFLYSHESVLVMSKKNTLATTLICDNEFCNFVNIKNIFLWLRYKLTRTFEW